MLGIGVGAFVLLHFPVVVLSNLVSDWADIRWKLAVPLLLVLMGALFQTWEGSVTARWLAVALLAVIFLAGGAATAMLVWEAAHGPSVWPAALTENARHPLFIVASAIGILFAGLAAVCLAVSPSIRAFQQAQRLVEQQEEGAA